MKKLGALLALGIMFSSIASALPKSGKLEDVVQIYPSKLMGFGQEMLGFEGQQFTVMTLMYDTDNDGFEDMKFSYQFMPYDETRLSVRLVEYSIDWSKNGNYEDSEIIRIDWAEELSQ